MILVDADSLVYACGFAAQKSISKLVVEDPSGEPSTDITDNMIDWKRMHPGWSVLDREVETEAQPEAYAIHALRLTLSTILNNCGRGKHELYITGKRNFREQIATIQPYKGNRDKLHKPVHYEALRAYLLEVGAKLVEGMEADDEVSIRARKIQSRKSGRGNCLVVSIDKDLNQIPGKHYNPQKEEFYEVGRLNADRWFYRQCLTGDSVDNVAGCWRVGPAAADKILDGTSTDGWWDAVVECYFRSVLKPDCPYAAIGPEAAALENARLVYMLRKPEEAVEWWKPESMSVCGAG